jgi:hypothetical protein
MAVLLFVRPIVRYRDRIAQSDGHGDGRGAEREAPIAVNGTWYECGLSRDSWLSNPQPHGQIHLVPGHFTGSNLGGDWFEGGGPEQR